MACCLHCHGTPLPIDGGLPIWTPRLQAPGCCGASRPPAEPCAPSWLSQAQAALQRALGCPLGGVAAARCWQLQGLTALCACGAALMGVCCRAWRARTTGGHVGRARCCAGFRRASPGGQGGRARCRQVFAYRCKLRRERPALPSPRPAPAAVQLAAAKRRQPAVIPRRRSRPAVPLLGWRAPATWLATVAGDRSGSVRGGLGQRWRRRLCAAVQLCQLTDAGAALAATSVTS